MILNGNYQRVDFDSLKPQLVELFTKYYGEEHRDTVEKRVKSTVYVPYHTFDYVNEYYKRFILQYRDEILSNFFGVTKLKATAKRGEMLIPYEADTLDDSPLLTVSEPTSYVMLNGGGSDTFQRLDKMKQQICSTFSIRQNEPDVDDRIYKLRRLLIGAIKQTEKNHPCDVFRDMQTIDDNYHNAYADLFKYIQKHSQLLSKADRNIISKSLCLPMDISRLDSNGLFFLGDISAPGYIEGYTTPAEAILKKGKDDTKYTVLYKRLMYMFQCGVEFQHIEEDELQLFNPLTLSDDLKSKIEKEYDYQTSLPNYPRINTKLADLIEVRRKGLSDMLIDNCKFDENLKSTKPYGYDHDSDADIQFFMMPEQKGGKINRQKRFIYFCEDELYTPHSRLGNLIHEANHSVSNSIVVNNYSQGEERIGLEVIPLQIFGNQIIDKGESDSYIVAAMENANEKQTRELVKLFLSMYDNPITDSDYPVPQEEFDPLYRYSDFLTQEFYSLFGEQIKEFNINPDYDIYFKKNIPMSLMELIKGQVSRKIDRKFRKSEYVGKTGILDYEKVRSLGALISTWEQNFVTQGLVNGVTPNDLVQGVNLENLDTGVIRAIFNLRKQKDSILEGMISDLERLTPYRILDPETIETSDEMTDDGMDTN